MWILLNNKGFYWTKLSEHFSNLKMLKHVFLNMKHKFSKQWVFLFLSLEAEDLCNTTRQKIHNFSVLMKFLFLFFKIYVLKDIYCDILKKIDEFDSAATFNEGDSNFITNKHYHCIFILQKMYVTQLNKTKTKVNCIYNIFVPGKHKSKKT